MKNKILKNIPILILSITVILILIKILKLNIIPNKYLFIIVGLELIILIITTLLYNLKKLIFKIISIILLLILLIGNILGLHYINKVDTYIDTNLKKETYTIKNEYYLLASINNPINTLEDTNKDNEIEYYKYSKSINKAKKDLGNYKYKDIDNVSDALYHTRINMNNLFLISTADYNYYFSSTNLTNKEEYKIIHTFTVEEIIEVNNEIKDSFNIYINGLDFTGIMRDYNLIATVNLKTRKVLLTSIPRDYYIDVPAYNMKDTLMCLGSLDSEVSKEALEKLFDTKIDYTINLNTNSLVKIVDTLGGIEFCSDFDFITDHALVQGTYNDKTGKKLHVIKGCKQYNGIEILTIARERMHLPGRDRYRQKNCRQILINIVKKMATPESIKNYNEILNSMDGLYTTDINDKMIKKIIKEAINNPNFEIIEQSVDGTDGIGIGHLGTQESWIMNPNEQDIINASKKIKEIIKK